MTDVVAFISAHFGSGIGLIYLDNVGCTGKESRLIDCDRNSVVSCRNGHREDAGVRCQGKRIVGNWGINVLINTQHPVQFLEQTVG